MYNLEALNAEWDSLEPEFAAFHQARRLEGTWNKLRQTRLRPNVIPELEQYSQGLAFMSGMLEDDCRIFKALHAMNPTMINAMVRGSNQADRERESDWKLCLASWWDNELNKARMLDDAAYEGQIQEGLTVVQLKAKYCDPTDMPEEMGCPVTADAVLVEACQWTGKFDNPDAFWYRYSVNVIESDLKNDKGERPTYHSKRGKELGWTSEPLPEDYYTVNAGKKVDIIVRDAVDLIAICPLPGCNHKQRRITCHIAKPGAKMEQAEEVANYDSPFEFCSFVVVGGDIRHTQRDPHLQLRPSAWVLYQLVLQYNDLFNELLTMVRRELSDDSKYIDPSGVDKETVTALTTNMEGGPRNTIDKPELGSGEMAVMPGTVKSFGSPNIQGLLRALDEIKEEYRRRRPGDALTGNLQISEATTSGVNVQVAGAGTLLGPDLANWDSGIVRIFHETRHCIRHVGHFSKTKTRYVATVSGRENVIGQRSKGAGQEVYIDAAKAEKGVQFFASTSKETSAEQRNKKMLALTGKKERILTQQNVWQDWGIFDTEAQEQEIFREDVRDFLKPLVQRRIALILAAKSSALTGMDLGEEAMVSQTLPNPELEAGQVHNSQAANDARINAPPPAPSMAPPMTVTQGGSSGLGQP